jgi:glycosyltransferase involved in cell wall biosynthesis
MKILIIGWSQFPSGDASSARIRIFAKGFIENGGEVHFITTAKLENKQGEISKPVMNWQGINFQSSYPIKNLFFWSIKFGIVNHLQSLIKSWKLVQTMIDKNECDIIYIYGWSFLAFYPIKLKAIRNKIPFFCDICEWYQNKHFNKWYINPVYYDDLLGRNYIAKKCSGVIAITNYIAKKIREKDIPVVLIPAVYDFSQIPVYEVSSENTSKQKRTLAVLYAGFCKHGDGLELLIHAVKIIKEKSIPIELFIIGTDGLTGVGLKYKIWCEQDNILQNIVHFKGKIPHDEYHKTLASVDILTLTRKKTLTNLAAFPTRLPEFLSTGRPVLTTYVHDVPLYLNADEHAKIVSPDSVYSIVDGILDLWNNPVKANAIGLAGKSRAAKIFDYRPYIDDLYKTFLNHKNNY